MDCLMFVFQESGNRFDDHRHVTERCEPLAVLRSRIGAPDSCHAERGAVAEDLLKHRFSPATTQP